MRFKEEVFAKIFTYITVILLLGIVIFEALTVQNERARYQEAEEEIASVQNSLKKTIDMNAVLSEKNADLEAFMKEWGPYAAFVESKEILSLKTDLFVRPDLIPIEAVDALEEKLARIDAEAEDGDGEENSKHQDSEGNKESPDDAEEEERRLNPEDFTFDNPEGEDIFLPLSTGVGDVQTCLVYTVAFHPQESLVVELLYEIDFEKQRSVIETDENGEIAWKCVSYNTGDGWIGVKQEESEEE